jgi:hypothetical protein
LIKSQEKHVQVKFIITIVQCTDKEQLKLINDFLNENEIIELNLTNQNQKIELSLATLKTRLKTIKIINLGNIELTGFSQL